MLSHLINTTKRKLPHWSGRESEAAVWPWSWLNEQPEAHHGIYSDVDREDCPTFLSYCSVKAYIFQCQSIRKYEISLTCVSRHNPRHNRSKRPFPLGWECSQLIYPHCTLAIPTRAARRQCLFVLVSPWVLPIPQSSYLLSSSSLETFLVQEKNYSITIACPLVHPS